MRHQVGVERVQALGSARDDRIDLDLDAEQRGEVGVGLEQRSVEAGRPDEDDADANRHWHRAQRSRVKPQRAERVFGADPLLAQDPLHALPDDRIGQEVGGAHDEDPAAGFVQRAGADAREVGEERAVAGAALEVAKEAWIRWVRVIDDRSR